MRATIFSLLLAGCCMNAPVLFAQQHQSKKADIPKEETVVIKKNNSGSPQTVVEIKNGEVYINGELVGSTDNKTSYKKIIIDGNADMPDFKFTSPWNSGKMNKAMLGVMSAPDNTSDGAAIQQVTPGSPAKKAGLKTGDVITKINETDIHNSKELVDAIGEHNAGDKISITYSRDGKIAQTDATLSGMLPQNFADMYRFHDMEDMGLPNTMVSPFTFDVSDEPSPRLGVSVEDRADDDGVTVLDVKPNSVADNAGLQKDDILLKLDGEKISSVNELQRDLRHAKANEKLKLEYRRGGKVETTDISLTRPNRKKDL